MKRAITVAVALALAGAVWADEPELARFGGGAFDGWDSTSLTNAAGLGGALVALSSGSDQLFDFRATPTLAILTLTAEEPAGTITNGGTIRLGVPSGWLCRFDNTAEVTIGGAAAAKVGTPAYSEDERALVIPVTGNFIAGDVLTIAGLRLVGLRLVSPGVRNLELDFDGDGQRDKYDDYSVAVQALWPGGSFDGWDGYTMKDAGDMLNRDGTTVRIR